MVQTFLLCYCSEKRSNMKSIIIRFFQLAILTSIFSGCTTSPQYIVDIDSINDGTTGKSRYILLSGKKGVSEDDLQFKEFAKYVDYALKKKGFIKTKTPTEADIAIFLFYAISGPSEHQYSYSLPVYGQTGVSSSHSYGTVTSYGSTASYAGSTYYTPTYGIVGSSQYSGTIITYTRYVSLNAIDLEEQKIGTEKQVWKTTIISSGSSGDLRKVFPILIAAGQNYFGENSNGKIRVCIYETDVQVENIKSALIGTK